MRACWKYSFLEPSDIEYQVDKDVRLVRFSISDDEYVLVALGDRAVYRRRLGSGLF